MQKIIFIGIFTGGAMGGITSNPITALCAAAAVIIFCFYLADLAKSITKN